MSPVTFWLTQSASSWASSGSTTLEWASISSAFASNSSWVMEGSAWTEVSRMISPSLSRLSVRKSFSGRFSICPGKRWRAHARRPSRSLGMVKGLGTKGMNLLRLTMTGKRASFSRYFSRSRLRMSWFALLGSRPLSSVGSTSTWKLRPSQSTKELMP